jgi:ubiquinone/menaquinone biosynthesis C-methylase UbiE
MTEYPICSAIAFEHVNFDDPIFQTIKSEYSDYETWRLHALATANIRCALVIEGSSRAYAGVALLKFGEGPTGTLPSGMKISTFKIMPGAAYGGVADLLLAQIFTTALEREIDVVFGTVFPDHEDLVRYLELRGFRRHAQQTPLGERIYVAELDHPERMYTDINRLAYDLLADQYSERSLSPGPNQESAEFLAGLLATRLRPPVRRILELGPGSGDVLAILGNTAEDTVGVDISARMAMVAQQNAPKSLLIIADALRIDFPQQSFDGIYAGAFLHLFPNVDAARLVRRIAGWTRDGGVVFANTSISSESGESLEVKSDYLHRVARYRSKWTEAQFRQLLEENGLTVTERFSTNESERAKFWVAFLCTPAEGQK